MAQSLNKTVEFHTTGVSYLDDKRPQEVQFQACISEDI